MAAGGVSLQNFQYFPPFCMLPQADELDANYYSENVQGTCVPAPFRNACVPRRIRLRRAANKPHVLKRLDAAAVADMVLRGGNRERRAVAGGGPRPSVSRAWLSSSILNDRSIMCASDRRIAGSHAAVTCFDCMVL
eukprot:349679-Chlamydomonas_euryale.AAC.1